MRFLSFRHRGADSYGAIVDDAVVDLGRKLGRQHPTLRAALAGIGLAKLKALATKTKATVPLAKIAYLPVIPDARKIICVGLNYREHRAETGRPDTEHPTLFLRIPDSQVGHRQPMLKPKESERFDWEGELAVIIGRGGRRIARDQAMRHVGGYACYHDGSVRDWQRHTTQFTPGKNFPATGPFGPWMVTADALKDIAKQTLITRINGVVKQRATIDMMIFGIPELIAYISVFTPLFPGDVIVTGTPGGVGAARNPPEFMKVGDVAEVEISGVGVLRNTVKEG
jgi:2-keto-4-pentenoate hydratase/2-oxohepta-3-ene-1,7-dioic acid hydratase in catechol pathway